MKLRINKNKLFDTMLIIYVFATLIVDIFRKLGNGQGLEIIRNFIYILVLLFVIVHIYMERSFRWDLLFILLIFPFQAFITLLITPKIAPVFSFFILYYFSRDFVGYYLFSRLGNMEVFKMNRTLIFLISICYSVMIILQGFRSDSYMLSSYNLIIPTCILLIYGMKEFKAIYFLGGSISFLTILLYGARGAVFCVGVGVILFLFKHIVDRKFNSKKMVLALIISSAVLWLVINFEYILKKILKMTNSRTIRLLLTGNIINGYGRSELYDAFKREISSNPFEFRGILADRVLAAQIMNQPISRGTYAHNIIYEILYEYGLIFGFFVLLFIFICLGCCIRKVIRIGNEDLFILLVSIFPVGFCSLFFSGSYLTTHYFWILMGLTYNILRGNFAKKMNGDKK